MGELHLIRFSLSKYLICLIVHDLDIVRKLCTRIFVMRVIRTCRSLFQIRMENDSSTRVNSSSTVAASAQCSSKTYARVTGRIVSNSIVIGRRSSVGHFAMLRLSSGIVCHTN